MNAMQIKTHKSVPLKYDRILEKAEVYTYLDEGDGLYKTYFKFMNAPTKELLETYQSQTCAVAGHHIHVHRKKGNLRVLADQKVEILFMPMTIVAILHILKSIGRNSTCPFQTNVLESDKESIIIKLAGTDKNSVKVRYLIYHTKFKKITYCCEEWANVFKACKKQMLSKNANVNLSI